MIMRVLVLFFMLFGSAIAQEMQVTGVVKDEAGIPIVGCSVRIKNTSQGTTTDFEGEYSIKVQKDSVLVFSSIGFETKEIKVEKSTTIDVVLKEDNQQLDEVVVVGYGTQRRASVVGSVRSIRGVGSIKGKSYRPKHKTHETYKVIEENKFKSVVEQPVSTFSADVDRASYSNIRRKIKFGNLPQKDAVRIEEMVNYFDYEYPEPQSDRPLQAHFELSQCPWNESNLLLKIGLQAKKIDLKTAPASNIVFLIDVSGSMGSPERLPLLKESFEMLLDKLRPTDKVAIVVYAGHEGLALPSTPVSEKEKIIRALYNLEAGGSTAGGAGLKLAYKVAKENFIKNGNNRIILATDGDFNVGLRSNGALERLVSKERANGVYISVLGFGMGNYRDDMVETIANKGNGNYAYIDSPSEAKKVLINEFGGTMFTIAKDVKLQLEFNPNYVKEYRLIGYENRLLNQEDFKDDTKDAGEIGSGHTMTALYELVSTDGKVENNLRYQDTKINRKGKTSNELGFLKIRYKKPDKAFARSIEFSQAIDFEPKPLSETSDNFRFASAVAQWGMLLRESDLKGQVSFEKIIHLAKGALGNDTEGYRKEFVSLVEKSKKISDKREK